MSTPSGYPSPDYAGQSHKRRLSFDPTINAGHVLTAVVTLASALAAGMAAFQSLDKRTSAVELKLDAMQESQKQRDAQQDLLVREAVVSIRESVSELRGDVKQLVREGRKP